MGACAILPRLIGQGRAAELLYTGRFMTAEEALAWGFYNEVVAPGEVSGKAAATAQRIADGVCRDLGVGHQFAVERFERLRSIRFEAEKAEA